MSEQLQRLLSGDILEEGVELSLAELCRSCELSSDEVLELVDYGVIEVSTSPGGRWRFQGHCLRRVRRAVRLRRDLGVNIAGVALALELLDELEAMHSRLRRLEELS